MRVFITGGFGFLGGRLAQHLMSTPGVEIRLGSRRAPAPPAWLPGATVTQSDWTSPASLERDCEGMEAVVHLARINGPDCAADPVEALAFNGVGTARLLQAAVRQRVKRFVNLSSAHVYGSPLTGVITEETSPRPMHPYATSLRAGEDVVRAANQRGEIAGTVIRLSNAYGAPSHQDANCWTLLMNDLCRQAVTTRRLVLGSSGLQRRDFIPMADACRAIAHVMRLTTADLPHDVVNVGGNWAPTVWEAACLVRGRCADLLGFQPEITRKPPAAGETTTHLDYRTDVLSGSGFRPGADRIGEIDRLIEFCKVSFR